MNFDLKAPCKNCPFNKVGAIELRPGRVEGIVRGLLKKDTEWFVCHKTIGKTNSHCMGAAAYLAREGRPNVQTRLALTFGQVTREQLEAIFPKLIDRIDLKGKKHA